MCRHILFTNSAGYEPHPVTAAWGEGSGNRLHQTSGIKAGSTSPGIEGSQRHQAAFTGVPVAGVCRLVRQYVADGGISLPCSGQPLAPFWTNTSLRVTHSGPTLASPTVVDSWLRGVSLHTGVVVRKAFQITKVR